MYETECCSNRTGNAVKWRWGCVYMEIFFIKKKPRKVLSKYAKNIHVTIIAKGPENLELSELSAKSKLIIGLSIWSVQLQSACSIESFVSTTRSLFGKVLGDLVVHCGISNCGCKTLISTVCQLPCKALFPSPLPSKPDSYGPGPSISHSDVISLDFKHLKDSWLIACCFQVNIIAEVTRFI